MNELTLTEAMVRLELAADQRDQEAIVEARKALRALFRVAQGNADPRPDQPVMDPHWVEGSQIDGEVKTFVVGQRVRLTQAYRDTLAPDIAERLGELGTVAWSTGRPDAELQVDLDVGGLWWAKPDDLEPCTESKVAAHSTLDAWAASGKPEPCALASGPGAIRLIDVEPIGQQPGFVNRGMTGEGDLELVPRYPRPKRDIDSYRRERRVGLRDLANALGVRPSVIGDIVRGAKSPARDVDWDRLFEAVDALAEV